MLMPKESTAYNILMYSHDTYGLGHIRRTMAIASHLRDVNTNVLILTGSPIAGRFHFPQQVDFVRIPGMIKRTNEDYQPLSIRIEQEKALAIRTNIILATARTFRPHLFIVDKEPLGLKKEVLPTLEWLKEASPSSLAILGLRDILDEAQVIRRDWQARNIYKYLDRLYDEIWVYGNQSIYDPIEMYDIPAHLQQKFQFTGYIPRKRRDTETRARVRRRYRIMEDDNFVVVTTGGGGDGYEVIDHFLAMHDYFPTSLPCKSIIITGPFMPKARTEELESRARTHGIKTLTFEPRLQDLIAAADLVVSMGGYNTICEILTQRTPALIIPRETPRLEQLIRATRLQAEGLLDYIPFHEVTPQLFRDKLMALFTNRTQYRAKMADFPLSGLDTMLARLTHFKAENAGRSATDRGKNPLSPSWRGAP